MTNCMSVQTMPIHFANILVPINAQLGNVSYVVCAIVGGVLALNGIGGLTLGGLASFLTFNKSFSMPINQISHAAKCDRYGDGRSRAYLPVCWMKSQR